MLSVRARAAHLATLRWIMVQLMETLARWVPTTPEMEAKVLFGEHIWDVAQHADALGRRVREMRSPLHFTLAPAPEYAGVLEALAAEATTSGRIACLYDAILPGLARRYESYLEASDALLDAPSFRITEGVLRDLERMRRDAAALRQTLPSLGQADAALSRRLATAEAAVIDVVRTDAIRTGRPA